MVEGWDTEISIVSAKAFILVLLSVFIAGFVRAADPESLKDRGPLWDRDVVPDLSRRRTGSGPLVQDASRAGLSFLTGKEIIVYAVVHANGQLSSRDSPEVSSPFRLRLQVLDAHSGSVLLDKEWGTRAHDSAVQVTTGGVLVKTGGVARLYSPNFTQARDLPVPVSPNATFVTSVSASQKTIMINCVTHGDSHTLFSRLEVLDAATLRVRYSWSQSPPLYPPYSISDTGIASAYFKSILYAPFGRENWSVIAERLGFCPGTNAPTLVSDLSVVYGCNELSWVSTSGRVLATSAFAKGDAISSPRTATSRDGRYIAVSLDTKEVKKHLFTEDSVKLLGTHTEVYDLLSTRRIFSVEISPLPKSDYDFALSPDGSKLAILNDRRVSVYPIAF